MDKIYNKCFLITTILIVGVLFISNTAFSSVQDEISKREQQIKELEQKISEYQVQINENRKKSITLEREVAIFNAQIRKIQLEIQSLNLAIETTNLEISQTGDRIEESIKKIEGLRKSLAGFIRLIDQADQESLIEILLKNDNFSDFFSNLENINLANEKAKITLDNLKKIKTDLEKKKEELQDKNKELLELKYIQEVQKRNLDIKRAEKATLLKETKGQEKKFQYLLKKTKTDIQKIKEQIQFLLQNGISVEDAIKYGQLAAIRAGIRPAFLLAVLDVESGLGRNLGSGNWYDDLYMCYRRRGKISVAESEKAAFLKIVNSLGLSPDSVKVSKSPRYGCGGAMGPAQFLPATWLIYADRVAEITGHNPPSPWSIEDAFMAAALKLAAAGASEKTRISEIRAAKTYIGGRPTCNSRICRYYANAVLNKAAEIERQL